MGENEKIEPVVGHILDCSKCPHVLYITKKQNDSEIELKEMGAKMENKVAWGHFKWILGALCAAAILIFGWNVTELKALHATVEQINISQQLMQKDIQALKK